MTLSERLDADLRGRLRSRYRPLPAVVPQSLGEPPAPPPQPRAPIVRRLEPVLKHRLPPVANLPKASPLQSSVSVSDVLVAVCAEWGVDRQELLGRCLARRLARPRHAAYLLLRRLTCLTSPAIAVVMCRADHTTILTGLRRALLLLADDADWRARYERASARCQAEQSATT